MQRGKFITIEGIDGAGKTAATETVLTAIKSANHKVVTSREPGGTSTGEALREMLLSHQFTFGSDTEVLLMFAARAQHLEELIWPNLKKGTWVLCERFTDSTYAYQGGGRKIPFDRIEILENWVQGEFRPDLTLLLDADIETGKQRMNGRAKMNNLELDGLDRFEDEPDKFQKRVRKAYKSIADANPNRVKFIDASKSVEAVQQETMHYIQEYLENCEAKST